MRSPESRVGEEVGLRYESKDGVRGEVIIRGLVDVYNKQSLYRCPVCPIPFHHVAY